MNDDEQRDPQEGTGAGTEVLVVENIELSFVDNHQTTANEGGDTSKNENETTTLSIENVTIIPTATATVTQENEEEKKNDEFAAMENADSTRMIESNDDKSNNKKADEADSSTEKIASTTEEEQETSLDPPPIIRTTDEPTDQPIKPSRVSSFEIGLNNKITEETENAPQDKPEEATNDKETIQPAATTTTTSASASEPSEVRPGKCLPSFVVESL